MQTLDRPVSRGRHLAWAVAALGFAAFFGWLFYERYWEWRECIASSLSSCITPDGENLTEGGVMWGVPVVPLLLFASWRLYRASKAEAEPR